jgi:multidrug efflux system outer membrane protein
MKRTFTLVLLSGLALGCAMGPNYKRPKVAVPEAFRDAPTPAEAASLADRAWWELITDPNLQALIDEALKNSYDARIAAARVEEYRANAGIARSPLFPQVSGSGAWQRGRESTYTYPPGWKPVTEIYAAQFQLNWELDIWGRLRRLNEAGRAQYLASMEGRRAVLLSLVADVASSYYNLCLLDRNLEIAKGTAEAYKGVYDLFNAKLQGGAASALETSSAAGAMGTVAATVPTLEAQIEAQENMLCFLVGRPPGPIARSKLPSTADLPLDVPAGLPSALLERRPDVLAAEHALAAYNANVGAAKASMFPTLSLTGILGGVSPEVNQLFGSGGTWSVTPGLFQPLFFGGRLWFQYEAARAYYGEALARYEQTVTYAFAETASALVNNQKLAAAEKEQEQSVAAFKEAVDLSNKRYEAGLASYYEVLTALQNLYPAEKALAQIRYERLSNFVNLYKALGGGWQNPDQAKPAPEAAEAAKGL